jgi:ribosomal protein L37AE/L43A
MDLIHKQGVVYETEEERRKGFLAALTRYSSKPWTCETCNITIRRGNKTKHLRSNHHKQSLTIG